MSASAIPSVRGAPRAAETDRYGRRLGSDERQSNRVAVAQMAGSTYSTTAVPCSTGRRHAALLQRGCRTVQLQASLSRKTIALPRDGEGDVVVVKSGTIRMLGQHAIDQRHRVAVAMGTTCICAENASLPHQRTLTAEGSFTAARDPASRDVVAGST